MIRCSESDLLSDGIERDEIALDGGVREYEAYGLSIRSEIPLAFPERSAAGSVDITFTFAPPECFARATADAHPSTDAKGWYEVLSCPDGSHLLRWPHLFEFLVSSDGRYVACRKLERATLESFQTYLFGHALSYALVNPGHEPLHATAVAIDGVAVALLGDCGRGKSTLAASLVAAGHRILTDDLLLIQEVNGVLCGFPGPPRLKLFLHVAQRFLPERAWYAPMNPLTAKLIVPLERTERCGEPVPVRCFFVLDSCDEQPDTSSLSVSPADSLIEIVRATFNTRIVRPQRLRQQFFAAQTLATRIPVRRLLYPRGLEMLDAVHRTILSDLRSSNQRLS